MAQIKASGTSPEVQLALHCAEIGAMPELNFAILGKPDFVFLKERVAVFIDGCFWHGCSEHYLPPANRQDFWQKKLFANQLRDLYVSEELNELGWRVIRIWEHDLRNPLALAIASLEIKAVLCSE
jgi:DNA mismatch endonuclease (patch repair protein)